MWWAVRRIGNTHALGYRTFERWQLSPWTQSSDAITTPLWLRLQTDGERIAASYSTEGPYQGYTAPVIIPAPAQLTWCGFSQRSDDSALSRYAVAFFEEAIIWTPNADRPFMVFAYRDPALPGPYDLAGARIQINKQRAARDDAAVTTARALVCNDPENGCNTTPLGGY